MAKAKFNLKEFLLHKGEVVVMGISGFILLLLLIWGASAWGNAVDPAAEVKKLTSNSQSILQRIESNEVDSSELEKLKPPSWLTERFTFKTARSDEFARREALLFDPVAQPSTKRENPRVLELTEYQVDLIRGAMLGCDIIIDENNQSQIAVLTTKAEGKYDPQKVKEAANVIKGVVNNRNKNKDRLPKANPPGFGQPPGQPPGQPGVGLPPGGGFGPGDEGDFGFGFGPGMMPTPGGQFDQAAKRNEVAIMYVPLDEVDTYVQKGHRPALTVIPVRLITVHAVVPYKAQLDELIKTLRLPPPPPLPTQYPNETKDAYEQRVAAVKAEIAKCYAEAKRWGPWYDGFEVQRRVMRLMPNGEIRILQDFVENKDPKDTSGNYPYEELYLDRIDSKAPVSHFDEGYIPYFLKPEMMLAMPLPQLVPELGVRYPEIRLKAINDNIEKLKRANQKEIPQSEFAKRVQGANPGRSIYRNRTADVIESLGYSDFQGPKAGFLPGMVPPTGKEGLPPIPKTGPGSPRIGPGSPELPPGYETADPTANEVENFLLRFVDCDVRPGYIYQYRFRLRMWNPNYKQDKLVANPEYAKESYQMLYSRWTETATIRVPDETFIYAHDVKEYRDKIKEAFTPPKDADAELKREMAAIANMLQVKDNQAVIQIATWMEQVRVGDSRKREPVGAWVVAEMPVGRGEYVGKRQYVKLPLWSSESKQYVLRELTDKLGKGKYQPKGWIIDFTSRAVLVDFEGGKVKTRSSFGFDPKTGALVQETRTFDEDVASELLIVQPDGSLNVLSSLKADRDPDRKLIVDQWNRWVKDVENRKASPGGKDDPSIYDPKRGP